MVKRYSCGILLRSNKILLGKRSTKRESYPGVWDFIGGHCEKNESYENAMSRELEEEIGVKPLDYGLITKIDKSPEFMLAIYLIKKWKGEPYNKDLDEHEIIQWFSLEEAKMLDFPYSDDNEILNLINAKIHEKD